MAGKGSRGKLVAHGGSDDARRALHVTLHVSRPSVYPWLALSTIVR